MVLTIASTLTAKYALKTGVRIENPLYIFINRNRTTTHAPFSTISHHFVEISIYRRLLKRKTSILIERQVLLPVIGD